MCTVFASVGLVAFIALMGCLFWVTSAAPFYWWRSGADWSHVIARGRRLRFPLIPVAIAAFAGGAWTLLVPLDC